MRHYFVPSEHKEEEYFDFSENFMGKNFVFKSCPDVFSKNSLDYGSLVLVKSIIEHQEIFSGKIMDMCCGYGTIAILLSNFIDAKYYLSDINSTAVELANYNVEKNAKNIDKNNIFVSDMFDKIEGKFNHIVSNPPIKVGKKYLLTFVEQSKDRLEDGGTLTLVIKKNLGAASIKDYLVNLFGNCEIWERDKGYYILHSKKTI